MPLMLAQTAATDTPWWVGVIVVGGLVLVAVSLVARTTTRVAAATSPDSWKDSAKRAYAALRRAYDESSEDAAIASPDRQVNLEATMSGARDHLYRLEALAPDGRVRTIAVECNEAAQGVAAAFRSRRDARSAYEATDPSDAAALRAAREREVRASQALAGTRLRLDKAVVALSGIN